MADITYSRKFTHDDWIDNEDVVQAGGEKGFNQKLHSIEAELDAISATFGVADTEVKRIQRVNFTNANPPVNLGPNTATAEFPIEIYDRTGMAPNVEKVYFPVILHVAGSTRIQFTVLYRQAPGNKIAVSIQFFNEDPATAAQFAFRIMTLATQ
jgi:hypothetical protein